MEQNIIARALISPGAHLPHSLGGLPGVPSGAEELHPHFHASGAVLLSPLLRTLALHGQDHHGWAGYTQCIARGGGGAQMAQLLKHPGCNLVHETVETGVGHLSSRCLARQHVRCYVLLCAAMCCYVLLCSSVPMPATLDPVPTQGWYWIWVTTLGEENWLHLPSQPSLPSICKISVVGTPVWGFGLGT